MGCSPSTRRDVRGAAKEGFETALHAGTKLPVVGGFVELLNDAKTEFQKLSHRLKETEEIVVWIQEVLALFEALDSRLRSAQDATIIEAPLRAIVIRAKDALVQLRDVAEHISSGSTPRKFLRSAIFANDFKAAKMKLEEARKILDTALAVDTNIKVHEISDDQKKLIDNNKKLIEMIQLAVRGNPQIDERVKSAVDRLAEGNAAETTRILDEAPAEVRESALALVARGSALITQVKYAEAAAVLEDAVKKDPSLASAWYALGGARIEMGHYVDAAGACDRAINLFEGEGKRESIESANAITLRGLALNDQGKYADAEIDLRRALRSYEQLRGENSPATATGLNNLAGLLESQVSF